MQCVGDGWVYVGSEQGLIGFILGSATAEGMPGHRFLRVIQ